MPHLHDMHCHVDLYADYQGLIEECEQEGIYTLAVTNTPSVFHACVELTRGRRYVRPALVLVCGAKWLKRLEKAMEAQQFPIGELNFSVVEHFLLWLGFMPCWPGRYGAGSRP